MKSALIGFIFLFPLQCLSQLGPGGVGGIDGATSLKIWIRADSGVNTTGSLINSIVNGAGVAALDISETGTQRPTLVTNAVNGYPEISYNGSTRLRTGTNLTTSNFITDEASTFVVCRADNTSQTSCVYTTDPLVSTTRFSCHIPWSATVYYDIGTCCSNDARMQVGSLSNLNAYSYWSYDASPSAGKQLYRDGSQLQTRSNTSDYTSHASQRFNIGGNTSGTNGFVGDVTEVIIYNQRINIAQRMIIENYLAAKYNITPASNDIYTQDNPGNGNYDHDVAGIGRINAANMHTDAQGTGILRVLNPTALGNNEFMIWGHDNASLYANETVDVPTGVEARMDRTWRFSEVSTAGAATEVGNVDLRWDLTGLGSVTTSDLRLLVDTDNDGNFDDETAIAGATALGSNIYEFSGVGSISNGLRITLGTINFSQTPLPVELIRFDAALQSDGTVELNWSTASETNNNCFEILRSADNKKWESILLIAGKGNSSTPSDYTTFDSEVAKGDNYYVLKQTDFDGTSSLSEVRYVHLEQQRANLKCSPNPVSDLITVSGISSDCEEWNVLNQVGEKRAVPIVNRTESQATFDTSSLPSGTYILQTCHGSAPFIKAN